MRPLLMMLALTTFRSATAQEFLQVKAMEHQLDDVMELIDTSEIKIKLHQTEINYQQQPSEINQLRLGIIYHETALNLSFLSKTTYKGYAQKSFDTLSALFYAPNTTKAFMPFIAAYRASALSLVAAETQKLKLLGNAFALLNESVQTYGSVSPLPEFLRGSVAENLPWYFFSKRKFAKQDFQSIIDHQTQNPAFANWKIMSFTYWAWANQHQGKKYRIQSLEYLDKAIALDPGYKAGRQRAEALKDKLKE